MLGFFAMANSVMANETKPITISKVVEDVKSLPSNTQDFLTSEWEKTKKYQKEGWADSKAQLKRNWSQIKSTFGIKND